MDEHPGGDAPFALENTQIPPQKENCQPSVEDLTRSSCLYICIKPVPFLLPPLSDILFFLWFNKTRGNGNSRTVAAKMAIHVTRKSKTKKKEAQEAASVWLCNIDVD